VHKSRQVHLDKKGREAFRKLTFKQRVLLAVPALRRLADSQGFGAEAAELFAALEDAARAMPGPATPPQGVLGAASRHRLLGSLRCLNLRVALAHIWREGAPEGLQRGALLDGLARIAEGLPPSGPPHWIFWPPSSKS